MNLCIFGDSISKGVIYDEKKGKYTFSKNSFARQLAARLDLTIQNYARFGCTSIKGQDILEHHKSDLASCDLTILEFGGNDCDLAWNEISETPWQPHTAAVSLEDFRENLTHMVDEIHEAGSTPVLLSLPPLESSRFYKWVSNGLDWEGILHFLKEDINNIFHWQEDYDQVIRRVAEEKDVPLIDIRKGFLEKDSYRDYLCIDGMHPNEKGHDLIADQIEASLHNL